VVEYRARRGAAQDWSEPVRPVATSEPTRGEPAGRFEVLSRRQRALVHTSPRPRFDGVSAAALAISDATHAHAADAPPLTSALTLATADAAHAQAADGPALAATTGLAVNDATHAQAVDVPALEVSGATTLALADASHAQAADGLLLSCATGLAINDASQGHAADGLDLGTAVAVAIADAVHGHSAEGVALTVGAWLAANDALQAQAADNAALVTATGITVADARHEHRADQPNLAASGGTAGAADVWAYVLSDGKTAGETLVENNRMLRIVMAAVAGTSSGTGSDTETYFGEDGTTPRVVASFDAQGNRTSVVVNGAP